jgi:hypothetical protein
MNIVDEAKDTTQFGRMCDRLVKKSRSKKLETYGQAKPSGMKLEEVFRLETERTTGSDWLPRYENRFQQVEDAGRQEAELSGDDRPADARAGERANRSGHRNSKRKRWHFQSGFTAVFAPTFQVEERVVNCST